MLRVVLTGGIASGKSAASAIFENLGIAVVDADRVSRELVEPGEPALDAIVHRFGRQILDATGHLDRGQLRQRVFDDPQQRQFLENLLHPLIERRMRQLAEQADSPYTVLVVPLLAEGSRRYGADRVLLIDAPESLQLQRLRARDGSSAEQAQRILQSQASREQRLAIADDVIKNVGTAAQLHEAVTKMHRNYLNMANQRPLRNKT